MSVPSLVVVLPDGRRLVDPSALAAVQEDVGVEATALLLHLVLVAAPTATHGRAVRIGDEDLAAELAAAGWGRGWSVKALNARISALIGAGLLSRPRRGVLVPDPSLTVTDDAPPVAQVIELRPAVGSPTVPFRDPEGAASRSGVPDRDLRSIMNMTDENDHHSAMRRPGGREAGLAAGSAAAVTELARSLGVSGPALAAVSVDPDRALACLHAARARAASVGGYFKRIYLDTPAWPTGYAPGLSARPCQAGVELVDAAGRVVPLPDPPAAPGTAAAGGSGPLGGLVCGDVDPDSTFSLPAASCPLCRRGLHPTRPA